MLLETICSLTCFAYLDDKLVALKRVRLIAIQEIAPPLLSHLRCCHTLDGHNASRRALISSAMTAMLESHWVLCTRVCAKVSFLSIAPSCANDNDNDDDNDTVMVKSDIRGFHLVPWNRRVRLRAIQFHSTKPFMSDNKSFHQIFWR